MRSAVTCADSDDQTAGPTVPVQQMKDGRRIILVANSDIVDSTSPRIPGKMSDDHTLPPYYWRPISQLGKPLGDNHALTEEASCFVRQR